MDYRETIQYNIRLLRASAILAAISIVVVPEFLLFVAIDTIWKLVTGSRDPANLTFTFVMLAIPLFPLLAIAVVTYTRMAMSAAIYDLLLNLDMNVERLTKRSNPPH